MFRNSNEWQLITMPLTLPNAVNDVEIRGFNFAPGTTDVYLDYIKYHPWRRPWLLFQ